MWSWFSTLLPTAVPFVAPAEVTLDADVEQLRLVDESGSGAEALTALQQVLGETGRFEVTEEAPVTVAIEALTVRTRGSKTEVVGTFRVADDQGTPLDAVTLTGADAAELGAAYGQRISPHRVSGERGLYTTGSPGLRAAAAQVAADDWDGAVETWRALVVSGDRREVARARHDLAVAAERAGRLDRALQLVRNAAPDLGAPTDTYVLTLEQRWVDAKLLREQLPELDAGPKRPDGMARGDLSPGW